MGKILFVKIHKALEEGRNIKDASGRAWKIKKNLGDSVDYVAGVDRGRIAGIFRVIEGRVGPEDGRYEFTLEEEKSNEIINQAEGIIKSAPRPMSWVLKTGDIRGN